jgi:hypothetical protein
MSALKIIAVKSKEDKFCSFDECNKDGMIKYAGFRIVIADYPAGFCCRECSKKLKQLWDSALDG